MLIYPLASSLILALSFYDYSKADLDGLCDILLDWDFHDCYLSSDVEVCSHSSSLLLKWEFLSLCQLFQAIAGIYPSQNGSTSINHPYLVDRLKKDKSKLRFSIDKARCNYESGLVQDFAFSKPSRLFSHINSLKKHNDFPLPMFLLSDKADTDAQNAELFNRFFFSVYSDASPFPSLSDLPPPPLIFFP